MSNESAPAPGRLIPLSLGVMDYRLCLDLQNRLHARVAAGEPAAYLLFVEHPPVLTLGKHADPRHLMFAEAAYRAEGVDVVAIDRGGEVTAHEPGQLVVYPILRLEDFRLAPRAYVTLLEDAVIETLAHFGVVGGRDPEHPGVWTGDRKICALGVRIRARVTIHGLTLNVRNSLELFGKIVPCGIQGRGVTSLTRELGRPVAMAAVQDELAQALTGRLAARANAYTVAAGLQWPVEDLMIRS